MASNAAPGNLKDRIAALQQKTATTSSSNIPQKVSLTDSRSSPKGPSLRDKIARFEKKGGVPVPRGSFGLGAPTTSPEGAAKRKGELYGNRIPSVGKPMVGVATHLTGNSVMSSRSGSLSPTPGARSPSGSFMQYPASDDGDVDSERGEVIPRSLSGSPVPSDDVNSIPTSLEGATLHILQSPGGGNSPLSIDDPMDLANPKESAQTTGEEIDNNVVITTPNAEGTLETGEMEDSGVSSAEDADLLPTTTVSKVEVEEVVPLSEPSAEKTTVDTPSSLSLISTDIEGRASSETITLATAGLPTDLPSPNQMTLEALPLKTESEDRSTSDRLSPRSSLPVEAVDPSTSNDRLPTPVDSPNALEEAPTTSISPTGANPGDQVNKTDEPPAAAPIPLHSDASESSSKLHLTTNSVELTPEVASPLSAQSPSALLSAISTISATSRSSSSRKPQLSLLPTVPSSDEYEPKIVVKPTARSFSAVVHSKKTTDSHQNSTEPPSPKEASAPAQVIVVKPRIVQSGTSTPASPDLSDLLQQAALLEERLDYSGEPTPNKAEVPFPSREQSKPTPPVSVPTPPVEQAVSSKPVLRRELRREASSGDVPPTPPPKSPPIWRNTIHGMSSQKNRWPSIAADGASEFSHDSSSVATPPSPINETADNSLYDASANSSMSSFWSVSKKSTRAITRSLSKSNSLVSKMLSKGNKSNGSLNAHDDRRNGRPSLSASEYGVLRDGHNPSARPESMMSTKSSFSLSFDRQLVDSFPSVPEDAPMRSTTLPHSTKKSSLPPSLTYSSSTQHGSRAPTLTLPAVNIPDDDLGSKDWLDIVISSHDN